MKRLVFIFAFLCVCLDAQGHDVITTKITWNREISRIVYARCATCHRQGGAAFSLISYQEALPWAKAIAKEALERRMPPWGAVKGFGDFRNDQALTQEQLELIANWVAGGAPEGDSPNDLPAQPRLPQDSPIIHRTGEIVATGDYRIPRPFRLDGLLPKAIPDGASLQITVELPDGTFKPLVWLHDYKDRLGHAFLLRTPLALPSGSVIHGLPPGSSLVLLPAIPPGVPEHLSARHSASVTRGQGSP